MFNVILAMAANPSGQQQGGGFAPSLMVLIAIFIIFYFLLIRPQQKQQKKLQEMRTALKKGDKVITNGGIYGIVQNVTDDIVSIQIADKVKVEVAKNSVAGKRE